jgi:hypothetical protein
MPTDAAAENFVSIVNEPVDTLAEKRFVLASKTPTTSALEGANTTFMPTAAAPWNLAFTDNDPVDTLAEKLFVLVAKMPTTSA